MRNEFSDEIIKVDKFGREFLSTTIGGGGGGILSYLQLQQSKREILI